MALRFRSKWWYAIAIALALFLYYNQRGYSPKVEAFHISPNAHPIAQLTARAEKQWTDLLSKQSKTLDQCVKEYIRRYNRRPPKDFDKWYNWAVEHGVKLIDEFDPIHHNLEPFWGLTPAQIDGRRRALLKTARSDRLLNLEIRNGQVQDDPKSPASTAHWPDNKYYYKLYEGIAHLLPDMDMILNLHDTPLIFIHREERERLVNLGRAGKFVSEEEHDIQHAKLDMEEGDMNWRDLRRMCHPDSAIWTGVTTDIFGEDTLGPNWAHQQLTFRLPMEQGGFMVDHARSMDLCHNPELRWQHGQFVDAQFHWVHLTENYLYPVFSWSVYPQSSDILIPTPYRWQEKKFPQKPWSEKRPKVGWSGTLSGISMNSPLNFLSQRFRLAKMIMPSPDKYDVLTRTTDKAGFERYDMIATDGDLMNEEWMNVNFVGEAKEFDNDYVGNLSRATVQFGGWMNDGERDEHKMLLDMDGWGWSARFRSLLWSGSAVVKAATFKEATSDWLIPWYHYIPLDYAYRDLYSIALYYLGLEGTDQVAHDEELHQIGRHGEAWVDEHAQWDHHVAWMYRLCLEWARVMSEDRASMDYTG